MSASSRSLLDPSTPAASSSARSRRHHQNPHHRHTAGTGGGGGAGSVVPPALNERLMQLMNESDHRDCSQGNKKALVAETLDRLRDLTKDLEEDDWMYDEKGENGRGAGAGLAGDFWSSR
eukprot:CAMPEP_0197442848 /NCGR_PEP_ID=MMETSP1175-20131217/8764_1 /TAXON_ID=1003142 /ORGANISM="Triceratium dubium, Strain CCMP147" /LENGTH=119 /DNA_ID=CAMNT_0042973397 /DNA_START=63 /DNA_END=422 /DNA_ORIENTATION=-